MVTSLTALQESHRAGRPRGWAIEHFHRSSSRAYQMRPGPCPADRSVESAWGPTVRIADRETERGREVRVLTEAGTWLRRSPMRVHLTRWILLERRHDRRSHRSIGSATVVGGRSPILGGERFGHANLSADQLWTLADHLDLTVQEGCDQGTCGA